MGLRQGVSRVGGRSCRHLSERKGQETRRAAGQGAGIADLHAAGRHGRGPDGEGIRADREGVGTTRLPAAFHRLFAEGGAARPRGRRRPRGLSEDHGRVLLVVHADGASGGAADEERRHHVHHDLLWQSDGGEELQCHGRREGGTRGCRALHRGRTRPERHPRARDLARTAGDARGIGYSRSSTN